VRQQQGEVELQIILVDPRLKRARTITLTGRTYALAVGGLATAVLLAVIGLFAVTLRISTEFRVPVLQDVVHLVMRDEVARKDQFVRDNVSAMARKLGEMQAQLMRLDALGERVSKMSGIRPEEFNFKELPGRGGPVDTATSRALTLDELQKEMERIDKGVGARADFMDVIESELVAAQVRRALLPQNTPVSEGFVGSSYGMRTDPFTGQLAMHAGVDFAAPIGTPIYAAAGGVVASAEMHPVYGNAVTIDHGNDLSTLYAHASRIHVKPGDIVKKGQKIAEVGTTGRSTGPHLHFEVHVKGQAQNPARFLAQQRDGSPFGAYDAKAAARPASKAPRVNVAGLAQAAAATTGAAPAVPAAPVAPAVD
jgi:murein DD-endopeptidase MepM/ murein hydrolase activator NlpD